MKCGLDKRFSIVLEYEFQFFIFNNIIVHWRCLLSHVKTMLLMIGILICAIEKGFYSSYVFVNLSPTEQLVIAKRERSIVQVSWWTILIIHFFFD